MTAESGLFQRIVRAFGLGRRGSGRVGAPTMIDCDEAMNRLYEFLDQELPEASAEEVEAHFNLCAGCRPRLLFEQSFLNALNRAREGESVPPELRAKVLKLLERGTNGSD